MPRPQTPPRAPFLLPLLLAAGCGQPQSLDQSDLLLLWTSNVHGYIEPCGCVAGQIGGIDRIASYLEDELAAHPAALWIDGGDLLSESFVEDDKPLTQQLPIKADAMLRVWSEIGCDAMALGEAELAMGRDRVEEWSRVYEVPILCANLVDGDGEIVFEESLVFERGGRKIGVFSVLAPRMDRPVAQSEDHVDVAAEVERQGLRLLPWHQTARRVATALAEECDLVLFASHAGYDNNVVFAENSEAADLVFGGHFGKSSMERAWVNDVPILVSFVRGSRVGRAEWWFEDEGDYQRPGGRARVHDVSDWVAGEVNVLVARDELEDLAGRDLGMGTEEWETHHQHHTNELRRHELAMSALGPPPVGNKFSSVLVPMHFGRRRSEIALRSIDTYHEELNAFWHGRNTDPLESEHYVGAESCKDCHARQYEFWLTTRHSRAFSTLQATGQEVDAECIGCHTIGYRKTEGFPMPNRYAGYENVQCASCHGPGGRHVFGGESYIQPGLLLSGAQGCIECHNKEHDPSFPEEWQERFPLVACPPLEGPGRGTPHLLDTYSVIAGRIERRREPDWGLASEMWHRAGDLDRSIKAAEVWFREDPLHQPASVALGLRYLEAGRPDDALPHFRRAVNRTPNNAGAHLGLGASLLESDPEAAYEHAREALSIRPSIDAIELEVRAHLALNRRSRALTTASAWLFASGPGTLVRPQEEFERLAVLLPSLRNSVMGG